MNDSPLAWETVIGLEVHVQLLTQSKIFCGCSTLFGQAPNTQGCPVCLGMPGSLPVLNQKVVEYAMRAALSLDCQIHDRSIFSRKNYFYPDLPKGYQISQYDQPFATDGFLQVEGRKIKIRRIHLEEDAGKLVHDQDPENTLFDVNRCGTPLIEIVTEPVLHSPREAFLFLEKLKRILEYLKICDCNMEEGSLRCDANVSLRKPGENRLGTKTELKNMNSFHGVEDALEYEIKRQAGLLESGGTIIQQTLLWDAKKGEASPMRSKEEAHDYRYFPDPDLLPLAVDPAWLSSVQNSLPELPEKRKTRFMETYLLREYDAEVLTGSIDIADYFEKASCHAKDSRLISSWIQTEILRLCKERRCGISMLPVSPINLASILNMLSAGTLNAATAKEVLASHLDNGRDPKDIVAEKGLTQMNGEEEIGSLLDKIILENPKDVLDYKNGKDKVLGYFVGQAMKASKGKANPAIVNKLLKEKLGR